MQVPQASSPGQDVHNDPQNRVLPELPIISQKALGQAAEHQPLRENSDANRVPQRRQVQFHQQRQQGQRVGGALPLHHQGPVRRPHRLPDY